MACGKVGRADDAGMRPKTCGNEAWRQARRELGKLCADGFEIAGRQTNAAADDDTPRREHRLYVAA